jgi:N-acetylglutamate synthase-like GNAT family acetyltransferase
MRDGEGRIVGAAMRCSWAGIAEIMQMWADEAHRGHGHTHDLLCAFMEESTGRGVRRIWVTSHDFQAPAMYEKSGFQAGGRTPRLARRAFQDRPLPDIVGRLANLSTAADFVKDQTLHE